jgi:hypothetical protein
MAYSHVPIASIDAGGARGKRLDGIGWAIFFILTGVLWLFPESQVPPGTWLIATGLLLLGLNAVRAFTKMPVSGFTTLLGALALAAGLTTLWGVDLPLLAIGLILLGVVILAGELVAPWWVGPRTGAREGER